MFFLKMRGGTPIFLIICLNNSPDHPERTADAFPVLQPDIRTFDSLNRGTQAQTRIWWPESRRGDFFSFDFSPIKNWYESTLIHDKQTLPLKSPEMHISLIKMLYFDNKR